LILSRFRLIFAIRSRGAARNCGAAIQLEGK